MKLYLREGSVQSCKLNVVLQTTNHVEIERILCKAGNITADSPLPRLPAFELPDGDHLFSANAICRYLWTKAGNTVDHDDERWLAYESVVLLPTVAGLLLGKKPPLKPLDSLGTPPKASSLGYLVVCSTLSALSSCSSSNKEFESILSSLAFYAEFASKFAPLIPKAIALDSLADVYNESALTLTSKQAAVHDGEDQHGLKLTPEFIDKAVAAWQANASGKPLPDTKPAEVLPEKGRRNMLITSALPYINNVPHLGNIVGSVLSADVFARFCRTRGYNTLFIGGTDEYGTATETKALEMRCTPRELCDKFYAVHRDVYEWFNIDFDKFGRTSTPKQTEVAQAVFRRLHANGYLSEDSVEQPYCEKCPRFLADRFVEGTCPLCGYEDARGDQCDKCSKLINAVDLKQPKCKLCKSTPVLRTSRHLFLNLPKIEPIYRKWLDKTLKAGQWTQTARVITNSWLRDGLKPRCITRDLKWGIPVPAEGFEGKVFYVWFDAPIGYMSISASYSDKWEQWWKNPDDVELTQFMGKDNVPFHSLIFPMCLIGSGENFTKVRNISATEYLNYEDTKFSKSRGVGVFGTDAKETGIPSDVWRFYMIYLRPESQDTAFSWADLQMKNNSELLNNLGNFINRCLAFTANNFAGQVPPFVGSLLEEDRLVIAQVARFYHSYLHHLEHCDMRDALRSLLMISKMGNQYIQLTKPWELVKNVDSKQRCGSILNIGVQICALIAGCLEPFMPDTAGTLRRQLNVSKLQLEEEFHPLIGAGHKIGKVAPLFKKIENEAIEAFRKRFAGSQDERAQAPVRQKPAELEAKVKEQGDKIRLLKAAKGDKETIAKEVSVLLSLKKQLHEAVEVQKLEPAVAPVVSSPTSPCTPAELEASVTKQGDKVRALKSSKADKSVIKKEVEVLLALKKQLETSRQTADAVAVTPSASRPAEAEINGRTTEDLETAVLSQGDKVRKLKADKAAKAVIDQEVAVLLDLKKSLAGAKGEPASGDSSKSRKKRNSKKSSE